MGEVTRSEEKRWEGLSPFQLKNELIELASEHTQQSSATMLNAGRGNPNWTCVPPRQAFFLLGQFAMEEVKREWDEWNTIGGIPQKKGIAQRLRAFCQNHRGSEGADLLMRSLVYGIETLGFDEDAWVYELADAVTGDNYPVSDRMLPHAERVVHEYLVAEMCNGESPAQPYELFATEGGTAAMCYIFDSLQANCLLERGDRIALMTPIFTPYMEIPELERFNFDVVQVKADKFSEDGYHTWRFNREEIEKLADPSVKLLCLVNPSDPPSMSLPRETLEQIKRITETGNPNLMIVTDDVYGTFVNDFVSLMSTCPRNTIGVYSFSKYFGATGWRLGVIAVNRDNIFDENITALPEAEKQKLQKRYETLTLDVSELRFIDRMVADSRDVALNHTAGLSPPQQVQMSLFALFSLMDRGENDAYRTATHTIMKRRLNALCHGMGVELPEDPLRAGYYVELDLLSFSQRHFGTAFTEWMQHNYEPVDPIFRLAEHSGVVLLNGGGFDGPEWSVRVSLANLPQSAYGSIGKDLAHVMKEYLREFASTGGKLSAAALALIGGE